MEKEKKKLFLGDLHDIPDGLECCKINVSCQCQGILKKARLVPRRSISITNSSRQRGKRASNK